MISEKRPARSIQLLLLSVIPLLGSAFRSPSIFKRHPRRPLLSTATTVPDAASAADFPAFISDRMLERSYSSPMMTSNAVDSRIARAIATGGLAGRGIPNKDAAWPTKGQVLSTIPKSCFQKNTAKSLTYALGSLAATLGCGWAGTAIPLQWAFAPVWLLYALVSSTVAMGCWVVAHECGHGAFSDRKWLQTTVGYLFHSSLLVPYFSWQRSHAVHHMYTNHVTDGETHVPPVVGSAGANAALATQSKLTGWRYGVVSAAGHLLFGWPLYLLQGSSGGPKYGTTSHFWPWHRSRTTLADGSRELFPTPTMKRSVFASDIGVVAVLGGLAAWAASAGWVSVALLYGFPLVFVNAWLVLYTWLQHTDVDVAHFDENDHTWVKGAFQTIDRPYGNLINFLHHNIGSTHVAHHLCAAVPHYHAKEATDALRAAYPEKYLFDPTPVPKALWRVAKNCVAVEKLPGKQGAYVFAHT